MFVYLHIVAQRMSTSDLGNNLNYSSPTVFSALSNEHLLSNKHWGMHLFHFGVFGGRRLLERGIYFIGIQI